MTVLPPDRISELNGAYERLCQGIGFREGEAFYTECPGTFELSYNENPLGSGDLARDVIRHHADFAHRYPPLAYSGLISKLAGMLDLRAENFLISAGSVTAIYYAVFQFADPGDKVMFSKSSMPWYKWSVMGNNSVPVEVPLLPDMNHDLQRMLDLLDDRTKVIVLSNPHNPTGLYIDESQLVAFYERLPKNVLLIVDQAYYEYQTHREKLLVKMINQVPNLMLTRTFSKMHGLAGLRVGYGMASRKVIEALKAKWLGSMPTTTSIATFAALQALDDHEHMERSRRFNEQLKEDVHALAGRHGLASLRSEANFVAVNVGDSVRGEKIFNELSIALTAGYFFGYPEWVRMSFDHRQGVLLAKLDEAFSAIATSRRTALG